MLKNFTKTKGFTMIELLVSIVVIAVISTVGFVSYSNSQKISRDFRRKQDLRAVQTALELYYQKNAGAYPIGSSWSTLDALEPTYINKIPLDPKNTGDFKYFYESASPGSTYLLCTNLENDSDKERNTTACSSLSATADYFKSPTE